MSSNQRTEAERTAEAVGVVVGAAYRCESISEERLHSVVDKARDVVMASAGDEADAAAAVGCFTAAFDTGQAAVESGRIEPQQAEQAFRELEHELLR
ncbi:MAG TPA: hypothetical protein VN681_15175 [Stellaceae bacterium]|nr:hypothetical protein [Stellaceae bacterium]